MKKYLKNIICGIACVVIIICGSVFSSFTKENKTANKGKNAIIELWHIDSFEGGKGSRKDFLLSSSLKFEKKHNAIISVISHTIQSATLALKDSCPDLISCGNGIDIVNIVKSIPIKSQDGVCQIKNKNYGVTWCRGGYALIGQGENTDLIVSQGEYTLPLLAYKKQGLSFKNIKVLPPQKAYQEYLLKGGYLLGTQRDIIRLTNRGIEVKYSPISCFCDLNQVICLTTTDTEKVGYCQDFISYLLSPERQLALESIGMLSVSNLDLYKDSPLKELQKTQIQSTQNFFTSPEILKNITIELKQELKTC